MPAVFGIADQGINQIGAGTDVQATQPLSLGDNPVVAAGKQVCQMVDKVSAPGDGWAQRVRRDQPAINAVPVRQQGTVKAAQGSRISKVDGRLPILALADKSL